MHVRDEEGRETAGEEVMLVCLEVAESLVGRMITDRTNTRGPAQGGGTASHGMCAEQQHECRRREHALRRMACAVNTTLCHAFC
ncbi:hypothetical protein QQF64_026554 [Cirrhinus molitorella]|uniref:Uncharacterized protein n=1 Tax=Cirrhinus molitorella TaxID=172907 RepID=A0ABR3N9Y6_9TELE